MRSFTLSMVAVFMCGMIFGQHAPKQNSGTIDKQVISEVSSAKTNDWIGYNERVNAFNYANNQEFGIMLDGFFGHFEVGNTIRKVRFYPVFVPNYTTIDYTLKIYTNPVKDPTYDDYVFAPNTAAYTENCTVSLGDENVPIENEITLSTPFIIPEGTETIIVALRTKGNCVVSFGAAISEEEAEDPLSLMSVVGGGESYWTTPIRMVSGREYYYPIAFQVYVSNIPAGISNITENSFKVYPNPSTGVFNVSVKETSSVNVYDVTGKLVNTAHVNAGEVYTFTQTTAGMYFVNVNGRVQKVVVK